MAAQNRERPLVLLRGPPQIMLPLLRRGELAGERLVEFGVERRGRIGLLEQERVGGIEQPPQPDLAWVLAGEDDSAFDLLAVCVRPGDESVGATVGRSATLPSR